jgi:hypothetical protein
MSAENAFDSIFARYVADLEAALPEVTAWFEQLKKSPKYRTGGFDIEETWPGLLGSHPRMIAIFRTYFLELAILIERLDLAEEEEDDEPADEDDWGSDDEDDDDYDDDDDDDDDDDEDDDLDERPDHPRHVLIEQLQAERPDLYQHFRQFMFIPVGVEDYLLVDREVGNE